MLPQDRSVVIEYIAKGYSNVYINILTDVRVYDIEQVRKQIRRDMDYVTTRGSV